MNLVRLKIDIDCLLRLAHCSECEISVIDDQLTVTYYDIRNQCRTVVVPGDTHEERLAFMAEDING